MKTWTLKRGDITLTIKLSKVDYIDHFPYGIHDMDHFNKKGKKRRMFVIEYIFLNAGVGWSDDRPSFKEACTYVGDSITEYIRDGFSLVI